MRALIVEACVDAGGSITGEHGVGVDKKRYMPKMFDDADLGAFQRLRCAFDPDQLANPGKVMPTPRLCGEVPGPYRRTRWSRRAWRSASDATVGASAPATREELAAELAAAAEAAVGARPRAAGTKLRLGGTAPRPTRAVHGRARPHRRAQRRRPDRRARGRRAAGRRAGAVRARRARCSRSTRRTRGATVGGVVAAATPGRCAPATAALRDLVVGMRVALSDGTLAKAAAR